MTDDSRDIPTETGRRAHVMRNGEVRGSGVGAGGGNPGEDYDNDQHGGDGGSPTGATATTKGTPAQGAGDREPGPKGLAE
ncbi:hypothetical protein [uncultured Sphingomonas sp.]|uniref:hypothetical protein n=1 Tax=uncultured Sphingomonas sp. TaxID=158754 RepID=UPI0035CBADEC